MASGGRFGSSAFRDPSDPNPRSIDCDPLVRHAPPTRPKHRNPFEKARFSGAGGFSVSGPEVQAQVVVVPTGREEPGSRNLAFLVRAQAAP